MSLDLIKEAMPGSMVAVRPLGDVAVEGKKIVNDFMIPHYM